MLSEFPIRRQLLIKNWPDSQSDQKLFEFSVFVHQIPLRFRFQSQKLQNELSQFFPKSWQTKHDSPIDILWQDPSEVGVTSQWDQIMSPDCQFFHNYISQRDFLAKKISARNYHLIANQCIDDGLYNFLRALLPVHLLQDRKFLFHSSCVVNSQNQAFLFFGPSGAGKTTLAQLCEESGGCVLGDDMNLVHLGEGEVFVEAASVGQRHFDKRYFGRPFRVHKAFWLVQSTNHCMKEITDGKKALLLSSVANLFWDQLNKTEYDKVFSIIRGLSQILDVFELQFKKEKEVWEYVQRESDYLSEK